MNRVLVYLDAPLVRRKQKRELLNLELEKLDLLAGSVLYLAIEEDEEQTGEMSICWRIGDYREGKNTFHMAFNSAEAAAELRVFAAECMEAAERLEGGAV